MDELKFWYNQTTREYKIYHTKVSGERGTENENRKFPHMDELATYLAEIIKKNPMAEMRNELPFYASTICGDGLSELPKYLKFHTKSCKFTVERPLDSRELKKLEKMIGEKTSTIVSL